ncbi:ATP-binding protein [Rhizobium johnstonii]|uniref:ATP-binding protein n=1 Tax=Rhizobium johnstonii TaxID=3019933 RepID=UPI003F9D8CE2
MTTRFDEDSFRATKVRVRKTYLELGTRGNQILERCDFIVENVKDFYAGAASPRRGVFVMGESGTGKSFALSHHLATYPAFQPKMNKYGRMTKPVVSIVAPDKSTTLDIMAKALKAMNVPVPKNGRDMRKTLLEQFAENETIVFHIDEMQHSTRSNTEATIRAMQEWLKLMLQIENYPLHVIVSGMPTLDRLLAEGQIERRSKVISFETLACPDDLKWVIFCVQEVAVKGCGLTLANDITSGKGLFYERLCHAAKGGFGIMVEMTQEACFRAMRAGRSEVALRHFANEYESNSSNPDLNIFKSRDWREIQSTYGTRK